MKYYLFAVFLAMLPALPTTPMFAQSLLPSPMQVYALRLGPGQDLRAALQQFTAQNKLDAACIVTCVGSLQKTVLRLADQDHHTAFDGKREIVSLVGTLATTGSHLHLSVSDSTGATLGGHLVEGC